MTHLRHTLWNPLQGSLPSAIVAVISIVAVLAASGRSSADDEASNHPLSTETRESLRKQAEETVASTTREIKADDKAIRAYSRRGDARFFLGKFEEAVADYDKTVELDPKLDASHWRRGIAYFYADEFKKAARQFEVYHTFDDVDRENGIWRFFSQARAHDLKTARKGLLKYKKDDREPFPAVYQLFAGKIEPDAILKQIREAEIKDDEREKRFFYAHLYIGLNHAVQNEPDKALPQLKKAVESEWPRDAGFGPNYMWHVGRLEYERLEKSRRAKQDAARAQ